MDDTGFSVVGIGASAGGIEAFQTFFAEMPWNTGMAFVVILHLRAGIILSGTDSDGALGLKAIKRCGGLTIAQGTDGSAPQYGEMPAVAIATGSGDLIAPVAKIPGHLLRVIGVPPLLADSTDPPYPSACPRFRNAAERYR